MELLKNLEGLTPDEQMTAVVELQKAAMQHLEEQKQASIGKSAELVIQGLKKIKSDFEERFNSLNYDIQTKVASLKDGEQGLQGPKGDQGERGIDGSNGRDGRDGKDGKDGVDGVDGVGVRDAKIDFDGSLVISLTDGREINCGEVVSVDVAKQIQKVTHNIQTGAGGDSQTVLDAIAALQATIATYGTIATQNANNVAITGGNINNTVIGGTTPAAGTFTTLRSASLASTGTTLNISNPDGVQFQIGGTFGGGTPTNNFVLFGRNAGSPIFSVQGTDTNINPLFSSKGSSSYLRLATGADSTSANAVEQLRVSHTASAVNYVQVTGAATNNNVAISAQGSDSSIGLSLASKAYAGVELQSGGRRQFLVTYATGNTEVNYNATKGSNTGMGVQFYAAGSDTNISQVFQSKGTGAIDLAAGSSGVNISNGGTVTALTRTATGSGYTAFPSVAITAPTTAGGVQATASVAQMVSNTATIQAGGTGYTLNDVVTLVGGTPATVAATYTVTAVTGGVVTAVTPLNFTAYTVLPTNPVSVTGGTGTGLTLNVTYGVQSSFTITNAGSGYVEQPTVTFSGGGGSGAAALAVVGGNTVLTTLGNLLSLNTARGTALQISSYGSSMVNSYAVFGSSSFSPAILEARGSDTNINAVVSSKGTGVVQFYTNNFSNGTGVEQFRVAHTASAVNYVQVTGAATGGAPVISSQGSDTNISITVASKGTGNAALQASSTGTASLLTDGGLTSLRGIPRATNGDTWLEVQRNVGFVDLIAASGVSNGDIRFTPRGTGLVRFGTYTAGAPTATGYISIKAADGTTYKVLVGT